MKLHEFLLTADKVKIGADDGSSFFYIGDAATLLEHEEYFASQLWRYVKNRVRNAAESVRLHEKNNPTPLDYAKKYRDGDAQGFMLYVNQWLKDYRRKVRYLEASTDYVKQFVPLFDREVISTKKAEPFDSEFTIVIIAGDEVGALWTADEGEGMKFA